jgi:hypothetical protein
MDDKLKARILEATEGSKFGAILRCALNVERDAIPRFTNKATVTSDGFVMCSFVDSDNYGHRGAFVGSKEDVLANVRGLSRHLQLDHAQHQELATVVDAWMGIEIIHVTGRVKKQEARP